MTSATKNKASQFGVVQLDEHKIVKLEEKPAKGKRDNLGNFISYLVDMDEVHGYTFTELWVDIGTAESLA